MLAVVGYTICHVNHGSWVVCYAGLISDRWIVLLGVWIFIAVLCIIPVKKRLAEEEKMMKREFGKEWDIWAKTVQFKLVPGVY